MLMRPARQPTASIAAHRSFASLIHYLGLQSLAAWGRKAVDERKRGSWAYRPASCQLRSRQGIP